MPDARVLFLTLTIRNVAGEEIGEAITGLYSAFQRLWRVAAVRRVAVGYFRGLEITYNRRRNDFHPHLHILVFVPKEYFRHGYIEQREWLALWQRATKDPSITQVDVRTVKPKSVGGDRLAGAVAEVSKYAVTGKNIIQADPASTMRVVGYVHAGLNGRRLAQFGGLLSKIKKELKMADAETASSKALVEIGNNPDCLCLTCRAHLERHVYFWMGGEAGDYVG
jgi:hypothetical protein